MSIEVMRKLAACGQEEDVVASALRDKVEAPISEEEQYEYGKMSIEV
jgi:hypothetical protein